MDHEQCICKENVTGKGNGTIEKDGIIVDRRQAEIILDFLYEMAEIAVDQYLSDSL